MEYPELKRTVLAHAKEWSPRNILIEDRASGTGRALKKVFAGICSLQNSLRREIVLSHVS
jgi:hypothetical protein